MNIDPLGKSLLAPDPTPGVPSGQQVASVATYNVLNQCIYALGTLWASGTTAQRPNDPVFSQIFFDTTLVSFIYCSVVRNGPTPAVWLPISSGGGSGTVTSITATTPIVVTPSPLTTVGVVSHATSGVTPATYGDATHVAQITVDSFGHATVVANVAITGGTGTVTSITATSPIVVTPSPITNTGVVSHAASGVTPTTYGDATHFPVITVEADGHITAASQNLISTGIGYAGLFGDGFDGDLTASSGTTTLARDTYFNNVTLSGTAVVNTNNFRMFVAGTLDITAAPAGAIGNPSGAGATGSTSAGGAGGSAAPANKYFGAPGGGGVGGTAGAGAGGQGAAGTLGTISNGGSSNASGKGGTGTNAGGIARPGSTIVTSYPLHHLSTFLVSIAVGALTTISGGAGGGGGGGGGGDPVHNAPGGAGGGAGGNVVALFARIIAIGASTPTGCISARGSNGGTTVAVTNANCGGSGGGAGGGGGWGYLAYGSISGTCANNWFDAPGGNGGNGSNSVTGGTTGGDGGLGGNGGNLIWFNMSTGIASFLVGSAPTLTGNGASGTTGGTGTAGGLCEASPV